METEREMAALERAVAMQKLTRSFELDHAATALRESALEDLRRAEDLEKQVCGQVTEQPCSGLGLVGQEHGF